MQITIDQLKEWRACGDGQKWFILRYPEGRAEYQDVLNALAEDGLPTYADWLMDVAGQDKGAISMQTKLFHSFAMTMSKPSEEDLCMAIDLAKALNALTDTWCASMPDEVAKLEGDDSIEPFDCYDDEQCGRALRHLLYTANRGSLLRIVFGMVVVLNPSNSYVNHEADTIELHPDTVDGIAAKTPRQLADWHEDDGTVLWWRMPVEEPPYCGSPLADDWPGCHTHWTPILVPDALTVEVSA